MQTINQFHFTFSFEILFPVRWGDIFNSNLINFVSVRQKARMTGRFRGILFLKNVSFTSMLNAFGNDKTYLLLKKSKRLEGWKKSLDFCT